MLACLDCTAVSLPATSAFSMTTHRKHIPRGARHLSPTMVAASFYLKRSGDGGWEGGAIEGLSSLVLFLSRSALLGPSARSSKKRFAMLDAESTSRKRLNLLPFVYFTWL